MKKIFLLSLFTVLSFAALAQTEQPIGVPNANQIGDDTSQMKLVDITINQFEDPGFWYGTIAADMGLITLRSRQGSPSGKLELDAERLANEEAVGAPFGEKVLGVKVKFFKRAIMSFSVLPVRPLPIPGKCKTISVWTIGRNFNHRLKLIVEDYFGDQHELTMEKLNFLGWKKLTVAVPPTIRQSDYHFSNTMGIKVVGFKVECDLKESFGAFYIYFDDLSAVTDLFESDYRDEDDIPDDW